MTTATTNYIKNALFLTALVLPALLPELSAQSQELRRPPRFDDLLHTQTLRSPGAQPFTLQADWNVSSDGALAYQVNRAPITRKGTKPVGGDVWVALPGQPAKNITNGEEDSSTWQFGRWSPNGKRLVLSGTRGGYRTHWVWERETGELRQLTKRAVGTDEGKEFYDWLDDDRIAADVLKNGVLPDDADAMLNFVPRAMAPLVKGWEKTFIGKEPGVSVIDGGADPVADSMLRQVIVIDANTGEFREVSALYRHSGSMTGQSVSPSKKHMALLGRASPEPGSFRHPNGELRFRLELFSLDGVPLNLSQPLPRNAGVMTHRWSVDGREVLYVAYSDFPTEPPSVVRVNVETGAVDLLELYGLDVSPAPGRWNIPRVEFTESGDIVFLVPRSVRFTDKYKNSRDLSSYDSGLLDCDWYWLRKSGGRPQRLTADVKPGQPVPDFLRYSQAGPLIGFMSRDVFRFDAATGKFINLTSDLPPLVDGLTTRIVWPADFIVRSRTQASFISDWQDRPKTPFIIVSTAEASSRYRTYYRLNTATGEKTILKMPDPECELIDMGPEAAIALYCTNKNAGRHIVWRGTAAGDSRPEKIFELNTWKTQVDVAETGKRIEYRTENNQPATGLLYLPQGYEEGKRYPTIVWVYPNMSHQLSRPNRDDFPNIRALGFSVFQPWTVGVYAMDRHRASSHGVQPGIDKIIELGYADPDRLFLEGGSDGGTMTLSLIAQVHRFKAAMAQFGPSNYATEWTTLHVNGRYSDNPGRMGIARPGRMGVGDLNYGTPLSNAALYDRNSPLWYAESIQTPLLLVHGDQDPNVDMIESDQMFSQLYFQRKRVRYARYWGEAHGIAVPANMRHLLITKLSWYDEFGDISRDQVGNPLFEGDRVKGRGEKPPLQHDDYLKFDMFQTGGPDAILTTQTLKRE